MSTYRAAATRDGRWWAVEIEGLPPNMVGVTQGRDLAEAEAMATEVVALLLDVPEDDIEIDLRVAGAEELLDDLAQARTDKEAAARAEQETLARVARDLTARGLTQRDAARLLGLSPQRVAQLAPRRAG
jgi:predicted RNase H-like HicB family nuclease